MLPEHVEESLGVGLHLVGDDLVQLGGFVHLLLNVPLAQIRVPQLPLMQDTLHRFRHARLHTVHFALPHAERVPIVQLWCGVKSLVKSCHRIFSTTMWWFFNFISDC